jgi:hypothetical protein
MAFTSQQIRDYIASVNNDPLKIAQAAAANGVSMDEIAAATGYDVGTVSDYIQTGIKNAGYDVYFSGGEQQGESGSTYTPLTISSFSKPVEDSKQKYEAFNANMQSIGIIDNGSLTGQILSDLGPVISAVVPVVGAELGGLLGVSATTGTALVNAGLQVAQGADATNVLKGLAVSQLSQAASSTVANELKSISSDPLTQKLITNIGTTVVKDVVTGNTNNIGQSLLGSVVGTVVGTQTGSNATGAAAATLAVTGNPQAAALAYVGAGGANQQKANQVVNQLQQSGIVDTTAASKLANNVGSSITTDGNITQLPAGAGLLDTNFTASTFNANQDEFGDLAGAQARAAANTNPASFSDTFAANRTAFGPNATFTWTNPATGVTGTYTTGTAAEAKAAADAKINALNAANLSTVTNASQTVAAQNDTAARAAAQAATTGLLASNGGTDYWSDGATTDAMGNVQLGDKGAGTPNTVLGQVVNQGSTVVGNIVQQGLSNLAQAGGQTLEFIGGTGAALGINKYDNTLTKAGQATTQFGENIQLASVNQANQNVINAISNADGLGAKIVAGASAIIANPLSANMAVVEILQEALPIGAATKVFSLAGKLAAIGTDVALNAAEAGGAAYNEKYQAAIKAGKTAEQADAEGTKAFYIASAVGAATTGIIDTAVINKITTAVEKAATKTATNAGKEAGSEFGEEFFTSAITDLALTGSIDLNKALTQGVVGGFVAGKTTGSIDVASNIGSSSAEIQNTLTQELNNVGLSTVGNSGNLNLLQDNKTGQFVTQGNADVTDLSGMTIDSVIGDLAKSDGATYAANNQGINAYYQSINDFLATNPSAQQISDAKAEFGVSDADIAAAQNFAVTQANLLSSNATGATNTNVNTLLNQLTNGNVVTGGSSNVTADPAAANIKAIADANAAAIAKATADAKAAADAKIAADAAAKIAADAKAAADAKIIADAKAASDAAAAAKVISDAAAAKAAADAKAAIEAQAAADAATDAATKAAAEAAAKVAADAAAKSAADAKAALEAQAAAKVAADAQAAIDAANAKALSDAAVAAAAAATKAASDAQAAIDAQAAANAKAASDAAIATNAKTNSNANSNLTAQNLINTIIATSPLTSVATDLSTNVGTNVNSNVTTTPTTTVTTPLTTSEIIRQILADLPVPPVPPTPPIPPVTTSLLPTTPTIIPPLVVPPVVNQVVPTVNANAVSPTIKIPPMLPTSTTPPIAPTTKWGIPAPYGPFVPSAPIDFGNRQLFVGTQWDKFLNPNYGKVPEPIQYSQPSNLSYNDLMGILGSKQGMPLSLIHI